MKVSTQEKTLDEHYFRNLKQIHRCLTNLPIDHENRRRNQRQFAGGLRVQITQCDTSVCVDGVQFPAEAKCYDLSQTGISLLVDSAIVLPENESYVLRLHMQDGQKIDVAAISRRTCDVMVDPDGIAYHSNTCEEITQCVDLDKTESAQLIGFEFIQERL